MSAITAIGWWKEPIKFLLLLLLIPVLPPTELSTWANRVVGIWTKSIPLRSIEAANPAKSPMTPPPKAMIKLLLSILNDKDSSKTFSNWEKFFVLSPP